MISRKFAIPGDVVFSGEAFPASHIDFMRIGPNYVATRLGMVEIRGKNLKLIPLSGFYIPRVEDEVIGIVINYDAFSWSVNINSILTAHLPIQDIVRGRRSGRGLLLPGEKFKLGDVIFAKIAAFDRTRDPLLTIQDKGLGKLERGWLIRVSAPKIPRVIGKNGSMKMLLENATGTKLLIGQNGFIVADGPTEGLAKVVKAIALIEQRAHFASLVDEVKALLGVDEK